MQAASCHRLDTKLLKFNIKGLLLDSANHQNFLIQTTQQTKWIRARIANSKLKIKKKHLDLAGLGRFLWLNGNKIRTLHSNVDFQQNVVIMPEKEEKAKIELRELQLVKDQQAPKFSVVFEVELYEQLKALQVVLWIVFLGVWKSCSLEAVKIVV
jgi:hypothetical protein